MFAEISRKPDMCRLDGKLMAIRLRTKRSHVRVVPGASLILKGLANSTSLSPSCFLPSVTHSVTHTRRKISFFALFTSHFPSLLQSEKKSDVIFNLKDGSACGRLFPRLWIVPVDFIKSFQTKDGNSSLPKREGLAESVNSPQARTTINTEC